MLSGGEEKIGNCEAKAYLAHTNKVFNTRIYNLWLWLGLVRDGLAR